MPSTIFVKTQFFPDPKNQVRCGLTFYNSTSMRWQLSKSISKCTFTKECGQVHGFRQVLNSNSLCLLTSFWLVYCILHIAHDKWLVFRMRCQGEQPLQIIFILLCSLPFSFVAKDWCTLIRTKHSSKTLLRLVRINVHQSLSIFEIICWLWKSHINEIFRND